jgi:hypothetical protein
VFLELLVTKRLGARRVDELAVPGVLALHTVGVNTDGREIPLDTRATRIVVAVVAGHFGACAFVKSLAAN